MLWCYCTKRGVNKGIWEGKTEVFVVIVSFCDLNSRCLILFLLCLSYLVPLSALGQSRASSSDVEQCLMFLKQMLARNLQLFVWECDCFGKQDNFNLGHHIMYLCNYIIFSEMKPQFLYTCTEKHRVVSVVWLLAPLNYNCVPYNVHFSVICVEQIIWFPLRTSCVDGGLSLHHDS